MKLFSRKPHKELDMTKGNPSGLLLQFAFPMLMGNIFQQLYSMVDSSVVGLARGEDALAAIGATSSLNFLFISLCIGLSTGIGILIAQYYGAREEEKVRKGIANAVYIMLGASILMSSIGICFARPILTFLETPENVLDNAILYFSITCAGMFAVAMYNCVSSILRALGDSVTPLLFLMLASVINIVLDLLFVLGFGMSVDGVALATIIAQAIAALGSILYARRNIPLFQMPWSDFRFDFTTCCRCLRLGLPVAFQSSLIAISCIALQRTINSFGDTVMAAFTAAGRFEQLVQQPFNSLGAAMATFTAQNAGAGNIDRIRQGVRSAFKLAGCFCLIMVPIAFLFGDAFMHLFAKNPDIISMGGNAIALVSLFYFPLGMIYISRNVLNGVGDTLFAYANGAVEVLCRVSLAVPLTSIPFIGVWGLWLTTCFTWVATGLFSFARYLSGSWTKRIHSGDDDNVYETV